MTNKEAIETLKQLILQGTDERLKKDYEAIDVAIKALKEERPQGNLISRDALKKEVERIFCVGSYHKDRIIGLIDNAPSVEYPFYAEAYQTGYEEGKNARKHGEWICKTKSTFPQYQPDEYKCPFCNVIVHRKTNYCEYCGADMRKGGAE